MDDERSGHGQYEMNKLVKRPNKYINRKKRVLLGIHADGEYALYGAALNSKLS
jgi:hypothetical protein